MSVEVNPVGIHCRMACQYCYEHEARRASWNARPRVVDHAAIQAQLLKVCGQDGFSLHGGEALLANIEDLEKLWAFGLEHWGKNGIQTSGADMTEEHFELIKKYKVHVGFSIDGPGELNDPRRRGPLPRTREAADRSNAWLLRCLREGVSASVITILHTENARGDRLPRLLDWFRELDAAGMTNARIHLLERDGPGKERLALTDEENVAALFALRDLERELKTLRFDVFKDMEAKLRDPGCSAACIWDWCDPLVTQSVTGIEPDGSRAGCGRDSKDGRRWTPLGMPTAWRQAALWRTPQSEGGCAGCRFFPMCGGQCPGTAIGGDWRKRSLDCAIWTAMFEKLEAEMVARGEKPASLGDVRAIVAQRLARPAQPAGHGDAPHGDRPHGDHTDHGDSSVQR